MTQYHPPITRTIAVRLCINIATGETNLAMTDGYDTVGVADLPSEHDARVEAAAWIMKVATTAALVGGLKKYLATQTLEEQTAGERELDAMLLAEAGSGPAAPSSSARAPKGRSGRSRKAKSSSVPSAG